MYAENAYGLCTCHSDPSEEVKSYSASVMIHVFTVCEDVHN
jgi:hypothetical protein